MANQGRAIQKLFIICVYNFVTFGNFVNHMKSLTVKALIKNEPTRAGARFKNCHKRAE